MYTYTLYLVLSAWIVNKKKIELYTLLYKHNKVIKFFIGNYAFLILKSI